MAAADMVCYLSRQPVDDQDMVQRYTAVRVEPEGEEGVLVQYVLELQEDRDRSHLVVQAAGTDEAAQRPRDLGDAQNVASQARRQC